MASKPATSKLQQVSVPNHTEEAAPVVTDMQRDADLNGEEDFNVHITEESLGALAPDAFKSVPPTLQLSHSQKTLQSFCPTKMLPATQAVQPLQSMTFATLANCAVRLANYQTQEAKHRHVRMRTTTSMGPTTPRMYTSQEGFNLPAHQMYQSSQQMQQTLYDQDNCSSREALINALEFMKQCQHSTEDVCIVSDLESQEEAVVHAQDYDEFDEAQPHLKNSDLMVETNVSHDTMGLGIEYQTSQEYMVIENEEPEETKSRTIGRSNYHTNRLFVPQPLQLLPEASISSPMHEYELEYFGSDGLKLTTQGDEVEDLMQSSPLQDLQIVVEEKDAYLQRESSETDYDLTDTPYSSQPASSGHSLKFEFSPDQQQYQRQYESQPRPPSSTSNLYRSYVSDFNPQSEIHASWQDTIQEESYEDEDFLSSTSSKKIKSALMVEKDTNIKQSKFKEFLKRSSASHSKLVSQVAAANASASANKAKSTNTGKRKTGKLSTAAKLSNLPTSRQSTQSLSGQYAQRKNTGSVQTTASHTRSITESTIAMTVLKQAKNQHNQQHRRTSSAKKPITMTIGSIASNGPKKTTTNTRSSKRRVTSSLIELPSSAKTKSAATDKLLYDSAPVGKKVQVVQSFQGGKNTGLSKTPRIASSTTLHKRATSYQQSSNKAIQAVEIFLNGAKKATAVGAKATGGVGRKRRSSQGKLEKSKQVL